MACVQYIQQRGRTRGGEGSALAAVVVMAAWLVAPAVADDARASAPAATMPVATAPAGRPLANPLQQAVRLSEKHARYLSEVQDRNSQLSEAPFYMMLAHAAGLAELSPEDFRGLLDAPAYANLLRYPARYRGPPVVPIRLRVKVHTVLRLSGDEGLGYSTFWPRGKCIWQMNCVNAGAEARSAEEPLTVYSVADPSELLGRPDREDSDGEQVYKAGRTIELAGLFYKIRSQLDRGEKRMRDYPVIIAWQLEQPGGNGGGVFFNSPYALLVGIILILVIALVLLKRYLSRTIKPVGWRGPEQRPDLDACQRDDQAQIEIDPLLKQAARQYLEERHRSDAADDKG